MGTDRATVEAYGATAAAYAVKAERGAAWVTEEIEFFAAALGHSGRVLEIGSGGGRDALALEQRGISVRRTDVAQGFVDLLRGDGFEADLLDPLTDALTDPRRPGVPYDGVWACACLIHVSRDDLGTVLRRLAETTRAGGQLHASVRDGDGEEVTVHGETGQRRYAETYWREPALRSVVEEAGWVVDDMRRRAGRPDDYWLIVRARRA